MKEENISQSQSTFQFAQQEQDEGALVEQDEVDISELDLNLLFTVMPELCDIENDDNDDNKAVNVGVGCNKKSEKALLEATSTSQRLNKTTASEESENCLVVEFVNEYNLIFTQNLSNRAKKTKSVFIRQVSCANIAFSVLDIDGTKIALTTDHLNWIRELPKQCFDSLQEKSPIAGNSFNFLKPLIAQNYEDRFLFVDKASLDLQLVFATRDLPALSLGEKQHSIQTFMMHHEGMILSFEPFSAPIGAVDVDDLNLLSSLVEKTASLLTDAVFDNKEQILQAGNDFMVASDNAIKAFTISVQPYFYQNISKTNNFKFDNPQLIEVEMEILNIGFDALQQMRGHVFLAFALEAVERVFNNFKLKHNFETSEGTSVLFIFKITFLNFLEQIFEITESRNIFYIKNARFQEKSYINDEGEEVVWCLQTPPLPDVIHASQEFQQGVLRLGLMEVLIENYQTSLKKGVLLETVATPLRAPIGEHLEELYELNSRVFQLAHKQQQNFKLITEKTSIKDLLTNVFLTHTKPTAVIADKESLLMQILKLEHNIELLSQTDQLKQKGEKVVLGTRFVMLDGFVTNLEAFDVLLGVVFDNFDNFEAINFRIKNTINLFHQIVKQRKTFSKLDVEVTPYLFFLDVALQQTQERLHETQMFQGDLALCEQATFSTFFYHFLNIADQKEIKFSCEEKEPFSHSYNGNGIKVLKLSLCPLEAVCESLAKRNMLYRYQTFQNLSFINHIFVDVRFHAENNSPKVDNKRNNMPLDQRRKLIKRKLVKNKDETTKKIPKLNLKATTELCLTDNYEPFSLNVDENEDETIGKNALAVFYDEERGCNVAFTQANFCSMKKRAKFIPEEHMQLLLMQGVDLENRAFNLTFPFARQNYVDNLLFVNNVEFDAQLQIIQHSLETFNKRDKVLSPLFLPHDGVTLTLTPFSCFIGALYFDGNKASIFEGIPFFEASAEKISNLLTLFVQENKEKLSSLLKRSLEVSNGAITSLTIGLKIYTLEGSKTLSQKDEVASTSKKEKARFRFNKLAKLIDDKNVFQIDHNFLAQKQLKIELSKYVLYEDFTSRMHQKQKLFVFKLFALNCVEQMKEVVEQNGLVYCEEQTLPFNPCTTKTLDLTQTTKPKKQLAIFLQGDYAKAVSLVCQLLEEDSTTLLKDEKKGLILKLIIDRSLMVPLGQKLKLKTLRENFSKQKGDEELLQILTQNSTPQQNVTVGYLMQNILFTYQKSGFISSTNSCFEFQLKRLRENLEKLSSGTENLKTEIVCFDGACFCLEPFDVIVGILFVQRHENIIVQESIPQVQQEIVELVEKSIEFYQQNGFIMQLEKIIAKNIEIEFVEQTLMEHGRKKRDVFKFGPSEEIQHPFSLFFDNFSGPLDHAMDITTFRSTWGLNNLLVKCWMKVFKVSLCSIRDLQTSLAASGRQYEVKIPEWVFPRKNFSRKNENYLAYILSSERCKQHYNVCLLQKQ